jgi:hypothetical protein
MAHANPDLFGAIFVFPGGFHYLKDFLGAVGKRFAGAGLDSLLVEAGVTSGEAAAAQIMSCTHFNRSLRAHKLLWETLNDRLVKQWRSAGGWQLMAQAGNGDKGEQILAARAWGQSKRTENAQFDFWLSYIELIDIALDFVRASRDGNFEAYKVCVVQMAPIFFEYDKSLYARITTLHLAMLECVERTHPTVALHLQSGHGLSYRRSMDPFTSVYMDLMMEHFNKTCKSPRGITNCATNPKARSAWFNSLPERTRVWEALQKSAVPPPKKRKREVQALFQTKQTNKQPPKCARLTSLR